MSSLSKKKEEKKKKMIRSKPAKKAAAKAGLKAKAKTNRIKMTSASLIRRRAKMKKNP